MKLNKLVFLIPFLLTSCGEKTNPLDKTKDTNLDFWITQKVTYEEMKEKGCTYLGGQALVGEFVFLDSKYTLPEDQPETLYKLPDAYVTYRIENYPKGNSSSKAITYIAVGDPNVKVFGLTFNSSDEEIAKRMKKIPEASEKENRIYLIENVKFNFGRDGIYIEAEVKDRQIILID